MLLIILIGVIVITSIRAFSDRNLYGKLMFNAYDVVHQKRFYRLFSHALVHGDWAHLFVNMLVLFSFGAAALQYYGYYLGGNANLLFLLLFILALPFSCTYSIYKHKDDFKYNAVGASGAVSAVVFSCIFFDPWNMIYFFGLIPIPGIVFGVLYLWYSYRMAKKGTDNIGHDAHFWGAVWGIVFPLIIEPSAFNVFISQLLNPNF